MPEPDLNTDEIRRLMQADWGDITAGATPLADIDRAARLYGIVNDPYHRMAFAGRSNIELMHICILGMLNERQWDKAARAIVRMDRMEREHARALLPPRAGQTAARCAAAPLEPSASPASAPDRPALSKRELWLQLKAARRDQQRARAGKPPFPKPRAVADASPPAPMPTNGGATRLPFT